MSEYYIPLIALKLLKPKQIPADLLTLDMEHTDLPRPIVSTRLEQTRVLRIGSVSFLNARPLIQGLDRSPRIDLRLDVPSKLLGGLEAGRFDVALLPVIDYQRLPGLRLLTAGGIGCDGPTLTVRLFSRRPIDQTRLLACDTDSHTSVALARVILAERFGLEPKFADLPVGHTAPRDATQLLIGDKVICEAPLDLPYQLDLGQAWKDLTGLPFVFAVWTAGPALGSVVLTELSAQLEQAKRIGLASVEELLALFAEPRGWPRDIARRYLCEYLKFDIGPRQLEAISLFHKLAARHGLIASPPRELDFWETKASSDSGTTRSERSSAGLRGG
jgi:chorismate dehydratase